MANLCRHGTDLDECDCMNCEYDEIEFQEWYAGLNRNVTPPDLVREAWFAAIKYLERQEFDC